MLAQYLTYTAADFTAGGGIVKFEAGSWDYAVIQPVTLSGSIEVSSTLDSGAVQGETDGNYKLAQNFSAVQVEKLADGTKLTTIVADGLYKAGVIGRYVALELATGTVDYVLVMLTKIS